MMNIREFLDNHPEGKEVRKKLKLGLWPIEDGLDKEQYRKAFRSSGVQLSRFLSGELKGLKFWQMEELFNILKITPNQFFGYPPEEESKPQEPILEKKRTPAIDKMIEKKSEEKKTKTFYKNPKVEGNKIIIRKVTVENE